MITRKDILAHLERGVRTEFLMGMKGYTPKRSPFCSDKTSDGAFEDYVAFGAAPWPVQNAGGFGSGGTVAETGAKKTGRIDSGRQIQIVGTEEQAIRVFNADFEIAVGLTHNAINDDRTGQLMEWARGVGQNFNKYLDWLAFDALEKGDGTTYGTCYDGSDFFDNDHVDPGAEYTTAQDNENAVTLTSLDNFESIKILSTKYLDLRGQTVGLSPDLLIVPVDLERDAVNICTNAEDYLTASRAKNPYAGTMRYIVAPGAWLAATAWFLVVTTEVSKPIALQIRQAPELVQWDDENAGDGGVRYMKWAARGMVFYQDWRLATQGNT